MPLKLSLKKVKSKKKHNKPVSTASLGHISSTPSLKAESFQNLEIPNRASLFQPCTPKRAIPIPTARRVTQWALGAPAKRPRQFPGTFRWLKCWQAREQKERAVNRNIHLRESETNLLRFPRPSSTPFLSSKQSKYRFSFLNLPPVKYLRPRYSPPGKKKKKKKEAVRFSMPRRVNSPPSLPPRFSRIPRGGAGKGSFGGSFPPGSALVSLGTALTSCSVLSSGASGQLESIFCLPRMRGPLQFRKVFILLSSKKALFF